MDFLSKSIVVIELIVGVASSHEVYAPLSQRFTLAEHINLLNQDVKFRRWRGYQAKSNLF